MKFGYEVALVMVVESLGSWRDDGVLVIRAIVHLQEIQVGHFSLR